MNHYKEKNIKNQGKSVTNSYDAFRMMKDSSRGIFSSKYGAWAGTLNTTSYHHKTIKTEFALGGDRTPLLLYFNKWMVGEDYHITRLKGAIPSSSSFVNMVEL